MAKSIGGLTSTLTSTTLDPDAAYIAVEQGSTSSKMLVEEYFKASRGEFNVKDYGAVGDNSTDDTSAIQEAIDAAETWVTSGDSTGAEVKFPRGTYLHTGLTVNQNAIMLSGDNIYATSLHFTSASGIGIEFTKGASQQFNCGLRDMTLKCTDTSSGTKIAVSVSDHSQFTVDNVAMSQCQGGDSTGLRVYGREMFRASNLYINATIPIRLSANPNDTTTYISADQFNFHNLYLIAHATDPSSLTQACFLVDDIYVSNLSFSGYQAWINRKHGFYYARSTTSRPVSHDIDLRNIRFEQADDATGYNIYIDFNSSTLQGQDVRIVNCKGTSENNGIYLRYIRDVLIDGWSKSGTLDALNVDRVSTLTGRALLISNGASSINMENMRLRSGGRPTDNNLDYVVDGVWNYEANTYSSKPVKRFQADTWAWAGELADDATLQLPINSDTQKWEIARVEVGAMNAAGNISEWAMFVVADIASDATYKGVQKVVGTTNTATTNSDTDLCCYCSGANPMEAPVYVRNRLGTACQVYVDIVGKRSTSAT